MRLFVALEIPAVLRELIAGFVRERRPSLPSARWVRADNLHLTLAFLGETPEERLPELSRALTPLFTSHPAFSVRLSGCGCFPPRGRARVVWIGFEASRRLSELGEAVRRALEAGFGLELERRPFHPHLTIARCSRPWPTGAVKSWQEAGEGCFGDPFVVERAVLMESRLGSGGARYSVVGDYPLRGTV